MNNSFFANQNAFDIENLTIEEVAQRILILLHKAIDENFSNAIPASRQFTQTILTLDESHPDTQKVKQALEKLKNQKPIQADDNSYLEVVENDSVYSQHSKMSSDEMAHVNNNFKNVINKKITENKSFVQQNKNILLQSYSTFNVDTKTIMVKRSVFQFKTIIFIIILLWIIGALVAGFLYWSTLSLIISNISKNIYNFVLYLFVRR